jgi:hypothetical protein
LRFPQSTSPHLDRTTYRTPSADAHRSGPRIAIVHSAEDQTSEPDSHPTRLPPRGFAGKWLQALVESMLATHRQSKRYQAQTQAQWLAEAGLSRAAAQLARHSDYTGETWQAPVGGTEAEIGEVTIRIEPKTETTPRQMIVEAVYPPTEHQRILVRRELSIP